MKVMQTRWYLHLRITSASTKSLQPSPKQGQNQAFSGEVDGFHSCYGIMDAEQNPATPSRHRQPSDTHNQLNPDPAHEGVSSYVPGQDTALQEHQRDVGSTPNNSHNTAPTHAAFSEEGDQSNERQYAESSPSQPNSSIRDQARVAVVIYDMLMRAGPQAESLSAQLAQAYPVSAALARQYAMHASRTMPDFAQRPTEAFQRRGCLVLRRVSVSSVAWFCSFISSIFALLRLWMIFSLALGATMASEADNALLSQLTDHVVNLAVERGPKRQLYRWMLTMLSEGSQLVAVDANGATAGQLQSLLPNEAVTALLISPVTSGLLGFIIGALAGLCINSALRAAGGFRLESRED